MRTCSSLSMLLTNAMTQMPLENSSGLSHINTKIKHFPYSFCSRAEPRITSSKVFASRDSFEAYYIALQDFDTYVDIHTFFQSRLSSLSMQGSTQDVQLPWPSASDLDSLVEIIIWSIRLRRHFSRFRHRWARCSQKKGGNLNIAYWPRPTLQQTFSATSHSECFHRVIGTILILHNPLSITELGCLLSFRLQIFSES